MTEMWTREEWERRKASLLEDVRILQAETQELRETATWLRSKGHEQPAQTIDQAVAHAEDIIEHVHSGFEALEE